MRVLSVALRVSAGGFAVEGDGGDGGVDLVVEAVVGALDVVGAGFVLVGLVDSEGRLASKRYSDMLLFGDGCDRSAEPAGVVG